MEKAQNRIKRKKLQWRHAKECSNQPNYNKDLFYIDKNDFTGIANEIIIGIIYSN